MTDIIVAARFTQNNSDNPATGLTLTDIDMYLTAVNKVTGVTTVVWDGTQNPTFEIDNVGGYGRIYTGADLDTYDYFGGGIYTGAAVLDADWVGGSLGFSEPPIGTAVEMNYIIQTPAGVPIEGVEVWLYTDAAATTNLVWYGTTDTFGQPRDEYDFKPRLDAGTYYVRRNKSGYVFDDPDTEVVS